MGCGQRTRLCVDSSGGSRAVGCNRASRHRIEGEWWTRSCAVGSGGVQAERRNRASRRLPGGALTLLGLDQLMIGAKNFSILVESCIDPSLAYAWMLVPVVTMRCERLAASWGSLPMKRSSLLPSTATKGGAVGRGLRCGPESPAVRGTHSGSRQGPGVAGTMTKSSSLTSSRVSLPGSSRSCMTRLRVSKTGPTASAGRLSASSALALGAGTHAKNENCRR